MINFRKRKEIPYLLPEAGVEEKMRDESLVVSDMQSVSETEEVQDEPVETVVPEIKEESENEENSECQDSGDVFLAEARAYAKGKGIDEEQLQAALKFIGNLRELGEDETPAIEVLETVLCGLDYNRAVSEARAKGELDGRNRQIEEVYMRPADSDGLPHLGGGGAVRRKTGSMNSIFDLARSAG